MVAQINRHIQLLAGRISGPLSVLKPLALDLFVPYIDVVRMGVVHFNYARRPLEVGGEGGADLSKRVLGAIAAAILVIAAVLAGLAIAGKKITSKLSTDGF
jgi:hypothetical protein